MRTEIAFQSSGTTVRGWLYRPNAPGDRPAIVMTHGFSAVKEMGLDGFARAFADAGFVVLVFDCRGLGSSDGDERGRIIPQEQHDDLRAAISLVGTLDGVDPARLGIWGTSYSGGHALFLGAMDPRIKCVVAQVPAINLGRAISHGVSREDLEAHLTWLAQDHEARNDGQASMRFAVVAPEGEPSIMPTADAWQWFTTQAPPSWNGTTTVESLARMTEYFPAAFIDLIAPKPLLLIAGEHDSLIPIDHAREAFARAGSPKRLVALPCGHFDVYPGHSHFAEAVSEATGWFKEHLGG